MLAARIPGVGSRPVKKRLLRCTKAPASRTPAGAPIAGNADGSAILVAYVLQGSMRYPFGYEIVKVPFQASVLH